MNYFKKPRLGVNIDHVATLRQQRGEIYPMPDLAAKVSIENGADQITMHLREDRRHVQDTDVLHIKKVCRDLNIPQNFEMGIAEEIIDIAIETQPQWICLVPEKREERTTEGGLDLSSSDQLSKMKNAISRLRYGVDNLKISLFVESDIEVLSRCVDLGVEAVEIHTGEYAIDFLKGNDWQKHLESYAKAKEFLIKNKVNCHAGHGLTGKSVQPLLDNNLFEEYNIGHWIIAQSVFSGLGAVVKGLKKQFTG